MHNKRKGQVALEFIITYGWAILASLIAISALVYFGASNPNIRLPDRCSFGNYFECTDWTINSTVAKLKIVNGLGQTVYSPSIIMTDNSAPCTIVAGDWASDDIREINCTNPPGSPFVSKDKAKVKISLYYLRKPTGYNQTSMGELYATVQ